MFTRFSQFVLVASLLLVSAQASAVPLAYGTYYDETVSSGCGGNTCRLNFSQTPSDKLLLVSRINCNLQTNLQPSALLLQISATSGGSGLQRNLWLPFSPAIVSGGIYYTTFREDTQFLVGQGRFPFVQMVFLAGIGGSISCTMIGSLVTPLP